MYKNNPEYQSFLYQLMIIQVSTLNCAGFIDISWSGSDLEIITLVIVEINNKLRVDGYHLTLPRP